MESSRDAFNEGDCPKFDAGDAAFMSRMLVVPMRSKFVPTLMPHDDANTYLMDVSVTERFGGWMSALADILVEHAQQSGAAEAAVLSGLAGGEDMQDWKASITGEANPYAEWIENNVVITGQKEDFVLMARMAVAAGAPGRVFARFAKAYFGGMRAQEVVVADRGMIKVDGAWQSVRGIVRGVVLGVGV